MNKIILVFLASLLITSLNSCSQKGEEKTSTNKVVSWTTVFIDGSTKYFKVNDSIDKNANSLIYPAAIEPGKALMGIIQSGVQSSGGSQFTAAQIAFFLRELSLNKIDRASVDAVLKKGGSTNKPEMVRLWKNIWSQYSKIIILLLKI